MKQNILTVERIKCTENIFSDSKEDWVELQVDLVDVLDKCKFLHKYEYESVNEITATSKVGNLDLSNMVSPWTGQKFDCIIPNSRIKVVFDSTKQQNAVSRQ